MPYRPGKRSAGYRRGRMLILLGISLAMLCLAIFATHQIYTRFFQPTGDSTTIPPLQIEDNSGEDTPDSLEAWRPIVTPETTRVTPENLPGVTESGLGLQTPVDPTGPDAPPTVPETTEPEVTEPEVVATDPPTEPPETVPATTEAPTTVPATTEAPTYVPPGQPVTTAPPTTVPPTTAPPTTAPPTTVPPTTAPTTTAPTTTQSPVQRNAQGIYSKAALLQRLDGAGGDLFALEADTRIYPASLAKMMTCIVALENGGSLDTSVTITETMLKGLKEAGASTAGFAVGETVTFRDLLYGLMLPSGADAANAVAVHTAGSVSAFVDMMNQKAADLGLSGTRFANTHGLHDSDQYATCRDLMTLLRYCMGNGHFKVLFSKGTYTTTATTEHPNGITLRNNMTTALGQNPLKTGTVMGNKTGFTTPAGQCLASWAQINGEDYLLITVGAGKSGYNTQRFNMLDAIELYNRLS